MKNNNTSNNNNTKSSSIFWFYDFKRLIKLMGFDLNNILVVNRFSNFNINIEGKIEIFLQNLVWSQSRAMNLNLWSADLHEAIWTVPRKNQIQN